MNATHATGASEVHSVGANGAAVGALAAVPVGEVEDASGSQRPAKRVRVQVGSARVLCSADMQCELKEALVSARSERETWTDKSWQQRAEKHENP